MVLALSLASLTPSSRSSSSSSDLPQHSAPLIRLLETPLGSPALSSQFQRGEVTELARAFDRLPAAARNQIQEAWGFAADDLIALGVERDPAMRDESLLQIAGRLENRDRLAQATAIYETLGASGSDSIAGRARARLDAIHGVGAAGARVEFLSRRFLREASRPEMLFAMGAAGLTFRVTRLAATARLAGSLDSAFAIRAAANSGAFLAETVAFTGASKLGGAALGISQDWSARALGREWLSGAISLFGLKAMGGLSSAALGRWARGSGTFEIFSRAALPQAAMLGGIMIGHRLEEQAGLRERQDHATNLVDSLALLVQFNIAGRLLQGIGGSEMRGFEASLDARTQSLSRPSSLLGGEALASILSGPRLAAIQGPSEGVSWMSAEGSGERPPEAPRSEGGASPASRPTPASEAETMVPPPFDPQSARYHLPRTKYFEELRRDLSFEGLVGYAQAVNRARLIGVNLRNTLQVPMVGPQEYSPYGAALVEHLRENPELVHSLTGKNERALIASPGTAILGLGAAGIGPDLVLQAEAADAIMQGKAKYFLLTAGVSATPLCVRSYFNADQRGALDAMEPRRRAEQARIWRAERFAETVLSIAPNFGFINIEDAQGKDLPLIFGILESLRGETALWSDDMQGTGIITAAAMLGWAELSGRLDSRGGLGNARGIIFGAGAGAMGVYEELVNNGMQPENILVTDSQGPLDAGRRDIESDPYKVRMREGIPEGMTVERFARNADFVLNLGVKDTFTDNPEWTRALIQSLAANPFVGAMTNPEPGVTPLQLSQIRSDAYYGSGNQTYENPVNNFTAFGYIGAGALMARAGAVSPAMTVAAARGIFEVAKLGPEPEWRERLPADRREFGRHWLVPRHDDLRLIAAEAGAVAKAAARDGVARSLGKNPRPDLLARFDREVDEQVELRQWSVSNLREGMVPEGRRYLAARYPQRYAPFHLSPSAEPLFEVAPEVPRDAFEHFAAEMAIEPRRWQNFLTVDGEFRPTAFPEVLEWLRPQAGAIESRRELGQREIRTIVQIAAISPAMGFALALRANQIGDPNVPTVFHEPAALRSLLALIPEARPALERNFENLPFPQ